MTTDATLTNALTAQNNSIAAMIETCEDAGDLLKAEKQVTFVADVWTALGYGYKLVELRERIKRRAKNLYYGEVEYISKCRKNDKTLRAAMHNRDNLLEMS